MARTAMEEAMAMLRSERISGAGDVLVEEAVDVAIRVEVGVAGSVLGAGEVAGRDVALGAGPAVKADAERVLGSGTFGAVPVRAAGRAALSGDEAPVGGVEHAILDARELGVAPRGKALGVFGRITGPGEERAVSVLLNVAAELLAGGRGDAHASLGEGDGARSGRGVTLGVGAHVQWLGRTVLAHKRADGRSGRVGARVGCAKVAVVAQRRRHADIVDADRRGAHVAKIGLVEHRLEKVVHKGIDPNVKHVIDTRNLPASSILYCSDSRMPGWLAARYSCMVSSAEKWVKSSHSTACELTPNCRCVQA